MPRGSVRKDRRPQSWRTRKLNSPQGGHAKRPIRSSLRTFFGMEPAPKEEVPEPGGYSGFGNEHRPPGTNRITQGTSRPANLREKRKGWKRLMDRLRKTASDGYRQVNTLKRRVGARKGSLRNRKRGCELGSQL
jgi:hypothetical protein